MGLVARVALLVALLAGGTAAGYAVSRETRPTTLTVPTAAPLEADPALPIDPDVPFAEDIDYPTLEPGLKYERHTLGSPENMWSYQVPEGWTPRDVEENLTPGTEVRWRPADEPTVGGYSVRLKIVNDHSTPDWMAAIKLMALQRSPESFPDFEVLQQTDDILGFTYRTPSGNVKRYNTFRWLTGPTGTEARVEMSVVGRERDVPGLDDLLAKVSASIRPATPEEIAGADAP